MIDILKDLHMPVRFALDVVRKLDDRSLCSFSQTCKAAKIIVRGSYIWKDKFEKENPWRYRQIDFLNLTYSDLPWEEMYTCSKFRSHFYVERAMARCHPTSSLMQVAKIVKSCKKTQDIVHKDIDEKVSSIGIEGIAKSVLVDVASASFLPLSVCITILTYPIN